MTTQYLRQQVKFPFWVHAAMIMSPLSLHMSAYEYLYQIKSIIYFALRNNFYFYIQGPGTCLWKTADHRSW